MICTIGCLINLKKMAQLSPDYSLLNYIYGSFTRDYFDETLKFRIRLFLAMDEKLLYKIHVMGRVQGVGFRWSAANEARNLGIKGFVKNLSNGSVYIEAEGFREQLNAFIEWCKKGPGFGFVESVNADPAPLANYTDFRIE
jgi:acylphosphatase